MTVPLPVGPLTPYVTPEILTNAPTGISWSSIPPGRNVTDAQHYAEALNICMRATGMADAYCNQVLRATVDTEYQSGPDYRLTYQQSTGNTRLLLQRWPILSITQIQVSPNTFPRNWVTVPSGFYDIEHPVVGLYGTAAASAAGEGGQSILIAPGYVNWTLGRNGYWVKATYVNGWPHTSLTTAATAGATSIQVDDCTGWATAAEATGVTGVTGIVYDSGQQETAQATATSAASGPGTVTLASPLAFDHPPGTLFSSMPEAVMWGVILYGASQALTRGATATTVQQIPGGGGNSGTGPSRPATLQEQGNQFLTPFKRTI